MSLMVTTGLPAKLAFTSEPGGGTGGRERNSVNRAFGEAGGESLSPILGHMLVEIFPRRTDLQRMRILMPQCPHHIEFSRGHAVIGTGIAPIEMVFGRQLRFLVVAPDRDVRVTGIRIPWSAVYQGHGIGEHRDGLEKSVCVSLRN